MDPLLLIVAVASAILFSYLGYVAGNYFPVIKRDPNSGQTATGEKLIETLKDLFNKTAELWKKPEPNEDETVEDTAEKPAAAIAKTKEPQLGNQKETIQVWHDRESSRIVAQIKGKHYDLDQPISQDVHGYISMLMVDLQEKVGLGAQIKEKIVKKQEEKADELKKPSFNPIRSLIDYVQADVPKLEEKTDSIPEQVNKILQEKLKGTPLEEKGVSMAEWPGRGVVFIVGLQVYDEIEYIPEKPVREAIRSAVKQWESKHTQQGK
jgi:hypothetical protein